MKFLFFFGCFVVECLGLSAQENAICKIRGQLKNISAARIYLVYIRNGQQTLDSANVTDGAYLFTEPVTAANPATLLDVSPINTRPAPADIVPIFLAPEAITIMHTDSFSHAMISGGAANAAFKKLMADEQPYKDREMALLPAYRKAQEAQDADMVKALEQQLNATEAAMDDSVYAPFVRKNPASPLALSVLQQYFTAYPEAPALPVLLAGLSPDIRESKAGKLFQQELAAVANTAIGATAMDFTQSDTAGRPVLLSSLKGRYVLLDFWASWCGPCRAENPNVVSAYAKYHPKGFEILGVSLDKPGDREKWVKAIRTDGLSWTQVSDLQFWNNAVARQYGVQSIPMNFLIDPQGKIIAKGLRGDELIQRLSEIFKD